MVTRPWPEAVERVSAFLRSAGAEARIEEFEGGTPTAADAAQAVGCGLRQIVKSLVFVCDSGPVLVLVPGDRRADAEKVRMAAEAAFARIAGSEEVQQATGFAPGAVAPFPLPRIDRIFIERTLLQHKVVWIGAGSPSHLAALGPSELQRLARAKPIDAVDEAK